MILTTYQTVVFVQWVSSFHLSLELICAGLKVLESIVGNHSKDAGVFVLKARFNPTLTLGVEIDLPALHVVGPATVFTVGGQMLHERRKAAWLGAKPLHANQWPGHFDFGLLGESGTHFSKELGFEFEPFIGNCGAHALSGLTGVERFDG